MTQQEKAEPRTTLNAVPTYADPDAWHVELDDEAAEFEPGIPVDPTDGPAETARTAKTVQDGALCKAAPDPASVTTWAAPARFERRAVVPLWMRSRQDASAAIRWSVVHSTSTISYHTIRVPRYAALLTGSSPRGMFRLTRIATRWVIDSEARPIRQALIGSSDANPSAWVRFEEARKRQFHLRAGLVAAVVMMSLIAGSFVWYTERLTDLSKAGILAALITVLGAAGRSADKPIITGAVVSPRARRLTADVVLRAFIGAGLCKDTEPILFPQPICRDGNGWRAVIDLPYGKTAEQAMKVRDKLASGLDLDEVLVWPERVRGSTGSARRVALWVADEDPFGKSAGAWPWAKSKAETSLFEPFPFGMDRRGRVVSFKLMFSSFLVGAIPRMGKTYAARLVACAAALDPVAELHIYDGKGGQDWRALGRVAHRVGYGARQETMLTLRDDLRAAQADIARRYDQLGKLSADVCPESKITPALARKRTLGLHPVVFIIDECQRFFEDAEYGQDIVAAATDLAKVGPAVGFILILATQKPDQKAIPTGLRDVIGTRFAGKVMTWQASEAVLGSGSYTAGYDASRFQRSHRGVGWLLGADDESDLDEAVVVRTYLADTAAVDAIIDRAYAARLAAGTLTGTAADEEIKVSPAVDVLSDTRSIYLSGEDRLWSATILDRLRELRSGHYDDWTAAHLAAALKPHGPVPVQISNDRTNRRGFHLAELTTASDARRNSQQAAS
jgi:S-DNA-T family DNA segregation ATPase FtsK/SpoIIIE